MSTKQAPRRAYGNEEDIAAAEAVRAAMGFGQIQAGATGAGAVGAGCGPNMGTSDMGGGQGGQGGNCTQPSVGYLLGIGAPTIALARARGDLVPWSFNISGTFPSTAVQVVSDLISSDESQLNQDALVREVKYEILNEGTTANQSNQQIIADSYFSYSQSGIQAFLLIKGRPGASPAAFYTPIEHLPAACGGGWTLRAYERPFLNLRNVQVLPWSQTLVTVTFCLWAPRCEDDAYSSNRKAICALQNEFPGICGSPVSAG